MGHFADELRVRGIVQVLKLRIDEEVASVRRFNMDDGGRVVDEGLQQGFAASEFLLGALALCDITDSTADQCALGRLQRTETDFDRHLVPIFMQTIEFQASPHRTRARRGDVARTIRGMLRAKTCRD